MKTFMDELLAEVDEKEQRVKLELDRLKADQLLMAISKLDVQIADVNKLADDEIALIEQYRKSEIERIEKKRSWLLFNLENYARTQMEQTGEKTIRLPHATLTLRKGRDKVEIDEPAVFMRVASRYGLLRVTPAKQEPDLQAVSAYIRRTGEIPIGVKLIPATINFSYTINGDNNNGTK